MKIARLTIALFLGLRSTVSFAQTPAQSQGPGLTATKNAAASAVPAQTPPMGWNSYNCYGSAVHEDEVKANADYMAQYLKPLGWQYVVVDFLWAYDNPPGSNIGNPYQSRLQDGAYIPWLAMDEYGRLLPHVNKFPSASGGKGFKSLADYIHSKGLLFGIHVMRGIPRQAVWAHSPVEGVPGITADQIADTNSRCDWMNHMYGLDMKKTGAQEYLNSLLRLYAAWGVDFIKVDDISRPYHQAEIEGYRKAINNCVRPIVLSISPGETPLKDSLNVSQNANMWRMADDFWDDWKALLHMFDYAQSWTGIGGPGHWPDCDMLQIGKISKRGPVGPERYSHFTDQELKTHMTFWCIYRSPLIMGGNLPENRPIEDSLLMNAEVIAVNQKGKDPHQLYKKDNKMVWVSTAPGATAGASPSSAPGAPDSGRPPASTPSWYVALFNLSDSTQTVEVNLKDLGIRGKASVRDLWQHSEQGILSGGFSQSIPAHGASLLRITGTRQ